MTPKEYKIKMREIHTLFTKIDSILSTMPNGLRQIINEYHVSDGTLDHCTYYGIQAAVELLNDAQKIMRDFKKNY